LEGIFELLVKLFHLLDKPQVFGQHVSELAVGVLVQQTDIFQSLFLLHHVIALLEAGQSLFEVCEVPAEEEVLSPPQNELGEHCQHVLGEKASLAVDLRHGADNCEVPVADLGTGSNHICEDTQDVVLKLNLLNELEQVEHWPKSIDQLRFAGDVLRVLGDLLQNVQALQEGPAAPHHSLTLLPATPELLYQSVGDSLNEVPDSGRGQQVHSFFYNVLHDLQKLNRLAVNDL
jgi:hypothetical protein